MPQSGNAKQSRSEPASSGAILILTASGGPFGSGHLRRMQALQAALERTGLASTLLDLSDLPVARDDSLNFLNQLAAGSQAAIAEVFPKIRVHLLEAAVVLCDLRDCAVHTLWDRLAQYGQARPLVALDNQNAQRLPVQAVEQQEATGTLRAGNEVQGNIKSLYYYDTLPHPALPLESILQQTLLDPDVLTAKSRTLAPRRERSQILVYAGSLVLSQIHSLARLLAAAPAGLRILWVGALPAAMQASIPEISVAGSGENLSRFVQHTSLARADFVQALQQSQFVLTYPGQTLLEAWYLEACPVLLPTESGVHQELSAYLVQAAGLPAVPVESRIDPKSGGRSAAGIHSARGAAGEAAFWLDAANWSSDLRPADRGQLRLIAMLQRLAGRHK